MNPAMAAASAPAVAKEREALTRGDPHVSGGANARVSARGPTRKRVMTGARGSICVSVGRA
jgi:hypothetical protein